MATKNYLRAWREKFELTQEELAEKVGTTKAVISLLENGHRGLSDKWLHKFGEALGMSAGHLLDHHPDDVDMDILATWANIDIGDRETAARVLKGFVKKGSGGKTGTDDA